MGVKEKALPQAQNIGSGDNLRIVSKDGESKNLDYTVLADTLEGGLLFGAIWDRTTKTLTRSRNAAGFPTDTSNFCHKGTINENYSNPFDQIYPWSEMQQVNVDLTLYRAGTNKLEDCIVAVYGDPDFTYFGTKDLFVGRYRPEFWYKSIVGDHDNVEFLISPVFRVGFRKSPAAIDGISFAVDAGQRNGLDVVTSGAGVPLTNVAVSSIHTRAKNNGFALEDIYNIDPVIVLYLVEYANMNGQNALGDGCANCYRQDASDTVSAITTVDGVSVVTLGSNGGASYCVPGVQVDFGASVGAATYKAVVASVDKTGATPVLTLDRELSSVTTGMYCSFHGFATCEFPYIGRSLGNASGYLGDNGKANAYYRGAVFFGNRYAYTLGIYRQTGANKLWLCPDTLDPNNYDALDTSVHRDTGVALPGASAWVTVGGNAQRIPDVHGFMAAGPTSSGSSDSPVGDQQYCSPDSSGNTVLFFGGRADSGWNDGPFCGAWNRDASDSYWNFAGVPLLKDPL